MGMSVCDQTQVRLGGTYGMDMPMRHPSGDVEHMIEDEVSFGNTKLALTSIQRGLKDTLLEESPRQRRYTEKEEG